MDSWKPERTKHIGVAKILKVCLLFALSVGVGGEAEITTTTKAARLHWSRVENGDAEYEAQKHKENRGSMVRIAGMRSDCESKHAAPEHKIDREIPLETSALSKGIVALAFIVLARFLQKKGPLIRWVAGKRRAVTILSKTKAKVKN